MTKKKPLEDEKVEYININKIKPDKNQPRKSWDQAKLKDMAEGIKVHGVIQPIEVDEKNIIVCGELRWRASKMAGLKEVPTLKRENMTAQDRLECQLIENLNRQEMTQIECLPTIRKLFATEQLGTKGQGKEGGIRKLARRIGMSPSWLMELIRFDREAPPILKKAVEDKKLSMSTATEIMFAPEDKRIEVTKRAVEKKMNQREVADLIKSIKNNSAPVAEAVAQGKITVEEAEKINKIEDEDLQRQTIKEIGTFSKPMIESEKIIEDAIRKTKNLDPLYEKPRNYKSWKHYAELYFKTGKKYYDLMDDTVEIARYIPPPLRDEIYKNNLRIMRKMEQTEDSFKENPYTVAIKVGE